MILALTLLMLHGYEPCEINPTPRVRRHKLGFAHVAWVTV